MTAPDFFVFVAIMVVTYVLAATHRRWLPLLHGLLIRLVVRTVFHGILDPIASMAFEARQAGEWSRLEAHQRRYVTVISTLVWALALFFPARW